MNYLWRLLIGLVVLLVLFLIVPLVFHLIGIPLTGDLLTIFKAVGALIFLGYVIWGPPVRPPVG